MPALGETFRTARESQGLSLSDVAERIHIRSAYLAAIEAEEWNAIGPLVYTRGFVRSYARALGLDPEAAAASFADRASGGGPAVTSSAPTAPVRSQPAVASLQHGTAARSGLSLGALAGVLVAFALVAFVGYEYLDYQHGTQRSATSAAAVPALPRDTQPEVSDPTAAPGTRLRSELTIDQGPSRFALRLRDNSWVRIVVDGKVAMEGLYAKGTARSFSGRSATVRAGNAGVVDIAVDGKELGPLGGLGDVAERSFQL